MNCRRQGATIMLALATLASLIVVGVSLADSIKMLPPGVQKFPNPDEFVSVEEPPTAISISDPVYPEEARRAGVEGDVWVKVIVDSGGTVGGVITEKASGKNAGFEIAAMKAALDGKWQPATIGGKPVACWVSYKVSFVLN